MSGFGALLRRGSSQRGLVETSEQETTSNSSTRERGIEGLLRKAKSLRGLESSGSRRHLDQQQQDDEHELGGLVGQRQNSSKSLLNGRAGIESSSSRRRLLNRQGSNDEGPSGVASFLSQIESSGETTAKPGDRRQRQAVARAESQKLMQSGSSSSSSNGGIRGFFRKAASLGNMARQKETENTDLQPVLIMTDENHGKVVFQHLEEDDDQITSEELTTFEKAYNHPHHLGSGSCNNLHYHHYNSQNLMNASLPDLSSTSTGSSSNSSGGGSAPESPNKVQQQQQALHSSFHSSMRESLFVERELFLDFSSSNLEDGNLEMRGQFESSSKTEPKQIPTQGQGQEQSNQDLEGRPSLPSKEEPVSRSGRGLGGRLGALFRRTKSGRSITESEASATEAQNSAAISPTKKRKKNGLFSSLASEARVKDNNDRSTSPDSPQRRRDTAAPFKSIQEISLPSLMDANDRVKDHQRRKADDVTEASDFMEGLMKVVEKYEDYQSASRHFSSDEEDFQYQNDEEDDDDGGIDEVDNINDKQEKSFEEEEEESDESEEHLEVEDEINDDPNFYERQFDEEGWTPSPAQSQFDIEVAPNAGYGEKREYDELELFYEEETFAHVGGSMLLGQASELMTVPEYDEEDYDDSNDDEDEGNYVADTNGPSLATVDEMDECCNSACSGEW